MIDDVIEAIKEGAASVHYYDYYCEFYMVVAIDLPHPHSHPHTPLVEIPELPVRSCT